jgi:hypothetical protein
MWYLDWKDTEEFNRQDFYLAQIAAAVERGYVKNPKKIKLKDKILKFRSDATKTKADKKKIQQSKDFWKRTVNLSGKKRKLPVKK